MIGGPKNLLFIFLMILSLTITMGCLGVEPIVKESGKWNCKETMPLSQRSEISNMTKTLLPCQFTRFNKLEVTTIQRCFKAHCIKIGNDSRICKCVTDLQEGVFFLESEGKRIGQWPGIAYLGETNDFEILKGDLDGNGSDEIIIANRDSTGTFASYWTIAVIDDLQNFQLPLIFRVNDYGEGTFVRNQEDNSCLILATEWLFDKDPKRGWGTYFVGRWFRYKVGLIEPAKELPIIARRYLFSFEKERRNTFDGYKGLPLKWLINPKTEVRLHDPFLRPKKLISTVEGYIRDISKVAAKPYDSDLTIEYNNSGKITRYRYKPWYNLPEINSIQHFGNAKTGRLYPLGYLALTVEQLLVTKHVSLSTYQDEQQDIWQVLWLED